MHEILIFEYLNVFFEGRVFKWLCVCTYYLLNKYLISYNIFLVHTIFLNGVLN